MGKSSLPDLVTDKNAVLLGFKDRSEASSVTIGEPFKLYQVDLLDLRRFNPTTDNVKDLLKLNTSLLIYPLLTKRPGDGLMTRSALVVSELKDKTWRPTNWGLAQLAQAMAKYRGREGYASGIIVWIPSLNLHFLGNKPDDNEDIKEDLMLIPLANRLAYGIEEGKEILAKTVFTFYAREANTLNENEPG
jgi:hypothetical protein